MSCRTTQERWDDRRGGRKKGREEEHKAPQAEGENVQSEGEGSFSCPSVPVQGPKDENPNSITGDEGLPWGLWSLSSMGWSWRQRRLTKQRLSVKGRGSWGRKRTHNPTLT